MGKKRNWSGVRQGKLTVIREAGRDSGGNVLWECVCDCGAEAVKSNKALGSGVKACTLKCAAVGRGLKHGMIRTPEYQVWVAMRDRCNNPRSKHYSRYGGRGIRVCGRWDSFAAFSGDMGPRPNGYTLERVDNDGPYSPENCRWASRKEQANNRSTCVNVEYDGREMTLTMWARELGIPAHRLRSRYKDGFRPPALFERELKVGRPRTSTVYREGREVSLKQLSLDTGIPYSTLLWRKKYGRDVLTGERQPVNE